MFEDIFFNNPILNFLPSLIFLSIVLVTSNSIAIFLEKNNTLSKNLINPVIIFLINLAILTSLINYSFLLGINIKFISFLFVIVNLIFLTLVNKKINNNIYFNFKKYSFNKLDVFILFFLIILFIISLFPVSDADSIAIHLNVPYTILNNDFLANNPKNLEFRVLSSSETILFLSPILKSDNFGSILNFLTLLIFLNYFFLNKKNIINILILSSPLIIFFISTQKLQLFFGLTYLSIIIILYEKKSFKKLDLAILALLINFFISGKINYVLIGLPLFLFCLIKIKDFNKIKKFTLYNIIFFLIIYFPILLKKFLLFGDPFSPFLEFIKTDSIELVKNLASSYRVSEGWYLSNDNFILIFLRLFIPFKFHLLSSSLGLVFVSIFLFKLFKDKKDFYILFIVSFFAIFLTGQLLPRYFLEIYLGVCFIIGNLNKSKTIELIKKISFIQIIIAFIFGASFIMLGFSSLYPFKDKIKYQTKYSYSYFNALEVHRLGIKENILDLKSDRDTFFFDENVYSARSINLMKRFSNNKNYFINFIKMNDIKYLITNKISDVPSCIELKNVKDLTYSDATRNFLTKHLVNKRTLFKILKINCTYD